MKMFDFALPSAITASKITPQEIITSLAKPLHNRVNLLKIYNFFNLIISLPHAQQCYYEVCKHTNTKTRMLPFVKATSD